MKTAVKSTITPTIRARYRPEDKGNCSHVRVDTVYTVFTSMILMT